MEPGIGFEFFEEAEDIGDGELSLAAMDKLDCLAALQINAGNQHGVSAWLDLSRQAKASRRARARCIVRLQAVVESRAISTEGGPRCCELRESVSIRE